MGEYIIQKDGAFNVFSTIMDAPLIDRGVSREQLEAWIKEEYGRRGLAELPERIARAEAHGCSALMPTMTLEDCIDYWVSTYKGKAADFVPRFLTIQATPRAEATRQKKVRFSKNQPEFGKGPG